MPKNSCSVRSCSYNQGGICDANTLKIVGEEANLTEATSCSTYTKNEKLNDALENEALQGETGTILCEVGTCVYHKNNHCSLASGIEVGNLGNVEDYRDTDCLSFERKSY